jgi:hypothetical protein
MIKTKEEHEAVMSRIAELMNGDPTFCSREECELRALMHLVGDYEGKRYFRRLNLLLRQDSNYVWDDKSRLLDENYP